MQKKELKGKERYKYRYLTETVNIKDITRGDYQVHIPFLQLNRMIFREYRNFGYNPEVWAYSYLINFENPNNDSQTDIIHIKNNPKYQSEYNFIVKKSYSAIHTYISHQSSRHLVIPFLKANLRRIIERMNSYLRAWERSFPKTSKSAKKVINSTLKEVSEEFYSIKPTSTVRKQLLDLAKMTKKLKNGYQGEIIRKLNGKLETQSYYKIIYSIQKREQTKAIRKFLSCWKCEADDLRTHLKCLVTILFDAIQIILDSEVSDQNERELLDHEYPDYIDTSLALKLNFNSHYMQYKDPKTKKSLEQISISINLGELIEKPRLIKFPGGKLIVLYDYQVNSKDHVVSIRRGSFSQSNPETCSFSTLQSHKRGNDDSMKSLDIIRWESYFDKWGNSSSMRLSRKKFEIVEMWEEDGESKSRITHLSSLATITDFGYHIHMEKKFNKIINVIRLDDSLELIEENLKYSIGWWKGDFIIRIHRNSVSRLRGQGCIIEIIGAGLYMRSEYEYGPSKLETGSQALDNLIPYIGVLTDQIPKTARDWYSDSNIQKVLGSRSRFPILYDSVDKSNSELNMFCTLLDKSIIDIELVLSDGTKFNPANLELRSIMNFLAKNNKKRLQSGKSLANYFGFENEDYLRIVLKKFGFIFTSSGEAVLNEHENAKLDPRYEQFHFAWANSHLRRVTVTIDGIPVEIKNIIYGYTGEPFLVG